MTAKKGKKKAPPPPISRQRSSKYDDLIDIVDAFRRKDDFYEVKLTVEELEDRDTHIKIRNKIAAAVRRRLGEGFNIYRSEDGVVIRLV